MLDMQTKFVEANGLRFEVLEEGTGDRLALCLHGFPEHAISWRHQIPVLAGMRYRVWAVNQRGYGRTTRPTQVADYALPHLVDDVTALINAASAKSVALIGHDWGAMVAWCVAAEQLHPLERLVIMNGPHPLCFRTALKHWRQMRKSWYVAFFQLPRVPERILTVNGGAIVRRMFGNVALPPDVLAVYTRQITEPGAATAMLNWYRAIRLQNSRTLNLARVIDMPTLVLWGERDVALDPICLNGTERYVRDLTVKRLPCCLPLGAARRATGSKQVATGVFGLALLRKVRTSTAELCYVSARRSSPQNSKLALFETASGPPQASGTSWHLVVLDLTGQGPFVGVCLKDPVDGDLSNRAAPAFCSPREGPICSTRHLDREYRCSRRTRAPEKVIFPQKSGRG